MPTPSAAPPRPLLDQATTASAPVLSPGYVKDTISAITTSRRVLMARLAGLDLFREPAAKLDDPLEIQLLFRARDDYLSATGKERSSAMNALTRLVSDIRSEVGTAGAEMNRLLITAMQAETAQKKINAILRIAANRATRNAALPSLSEMMSEVTREEDPDDPESGRETQTAAQEDDGPGCAPELQAEPHPGYVPPE